MDSKNGYHYGSLYGGYLIKMKEWMDKFKKLAVTGCTLLLLSACGANTTIDNMNQPGTSNTPNVTNINSIQNPSKGNNSNTVDIVNPKVSFSEAITLFNKAYPDAKIESIDLETAFGGLYYDIEGFDATKEYELKIDATTKEIKANEYEKNRDTDEILDLSNVMDPSEAIAIALQVPEVQGLAPTGWSLDADYGIQIYKVEFKKNLEEIDVKINANTGEILEVDVDD